MNKGRRRFLRAFLSAMAAILLVCTRALIVLAEAIRKVTPSNILGPFYRRGAPMGTKLSPPGDKGTPLFISGQVMNTEGKALANVMVDVWQANAGGHYDNDDPNNPPPPNVFRYRGVMKTDKDGNYAFETVVPGRYKLGDGHERPQHIHYMVSATGCKTLITQLYFESDPYFEGNVEKNLHKDPFVQHRELVIPLAKDDKSKGFKGVFHIVLAKA